MKKAFLLLFLLLFCMAISIPSDFVLATKDEIQKDIDELSQEIDEKTELVGDLSEKISLYQENIKKKQEEGLNLENQIDILENSINKTETEITITETEISKITSEIKLVKSKIEGTQTDIDDKQIQVSEYILNIYEAEQQTNLEILLTNSTLSDYFTHLEYTRRFQEELQKNLTQLQTLKDKLSAQKEELNTSKKEETNKKNTLDVQQNGLKSEKIVKDDLLTNTEQDEEKFQELVKKVKQEQASIDSQIAALEKQMRTKIDQQNPDGTDATTPTDSTTPDNFEMPENFSPMWPVDSQRVTAYFHDPTYPFRRWFEHDAIDIGIGQGSPIYAADTGVVAIAKHDGSTAYSYIMIIHADGFATIYGHTSAVYVAPDQKVIKGQNIGLSGGMPGTAGAGAYTTGPHIHFGVRLNGVPVNPLNYLP